MKRVFYNKKYAYEFLIFLFFIFLGVIFIVNSGSKDYRLA